ncbi:hypothetical protein Vafri_19353 [Volvox africanus]|uniref:Uncharacterized protein n=1 Tax=Volvox africanus TaxID=51714 RepID=A0A8J4BUR4_9CHLO|nr:hypothetical protein Vafri_19353 [Volvox africanus]
MATRDDDFGLAGGGLDAPTTALRATRWEPAAELNSAAGPDVTRDPRLLLDPRTPLHPPVPIVAATAPRPEEQRAPAVASPRQGHDGDMDVEDPTLDTEADDQETATDRRGPKAAAAAVRTDRGRGARGTSGAGRQRRSSSAGQSTDPVRGKRKGDSPSAAVVHKAGSGTKRQRTDDNWLSKWGCTRSELECRRRKGVCLRCASDHVTRECPLLPAYTPKLDQ